MNTILDRCFRFWTYSDELCVSPIKTLEPNQQFLFYETNFGLYLCVTTVSNILIVHFRLILADSKVKHWNWESLEKALGILQFVFLHIFVMH